MKFNEFSHIYRYAKGWYKKTENKMEDLKKVLNHAYYDPEDSDVINIISTLAFKHIQKSGNPEYRFGKLIEDLNPDSFFNKRFFSELSFQDRLISSCLSIIGLCHKDEIDGELAEPNENILPLSESTIKIKQEI